MLEQWEHHRFLKKHGCKTQREYDLKYDDDYDPYGSCLKEIYHGYKCMWLMVTSSGNDFSYGKIAELRKWCDNNCKEKYRSDWHRGFYDSMKNDFIISDMNFNDEMVFAFKSEQDYIWFLLNCAET